MARNAGTLPYHGEERKTADRSRATPARIVAWQGAYISPIDRWTLETNLTPSPWTDECIRLNERWIHAMHRTLGLAPPNLPPPLPEPEP